MNLPGTQIFLRPTLADLCADWGAFGFSAKQAVHDLVQIHLRYGSAKGRGNRARRRIARLYPFRWQAEQALQGHPRGFPPPTLSREQVEKLYSGFTDLNERGERWEGGRGWVKRG